VALGALLTLGAAIARAQTPQTGAAAGATAGVTAGVLGQTPTAPEAAAATPTVPTPTPPPHDPAFAAWLQALRGDALALGVKPATIDAAFATIVAQPVVLERDRSQAEFTLTLGQYLERRLTPALLRLGREHRARQRTLLLRVEREYKVPHSTLVAVWGLESNFGRFAGVRPTVPVLATLAYDGRRAALFRGELLNALRILDRGDIELDRLKGSWAGAMGQPQFLPSSYLKFAQDFDGDGRRDIWTSLPDVLASIAFYMQSNGWTPGESWGRRITLPPDFDARLGDKAPLRVQGCRAVRQLTEPLMINEWRALGVKTARGLPLPRSSMAASLLRADGETFLVYRNYETLLTYNCAHSYAIAVGLLGDRLDGKTESWPAAKRKAKPARAKAAAGKAKAKRSTSGSSRRRSR
jgi:membrane-bound lytic murein transglycosylase B